MNLGISNLEQLPWQTANAFEELIVQIQAFMNGTASAINPNQTTASPFDQSTLFNHVNTQFATNAPWSLRWLNGPWLADPDGNSTHVAILRPPKWAANQHDYAPQGIDTALGMEVETDAARNLTGVKIAARSKRFLLIVNVGNFAITIKHNDATSAAVNRFGLPAGNDLVLGSAEMAWMFYSVGSEVWRLAGTSSSTFGGTPAGQGTLKFIKFSLTDAQVKSLGTTPVSAIPAPGAGKVIFVQQWMSYSVIRNAYTSATRTVSLRFVGSSTSVTNTMNNATSLTLEDQWRTAFGTQASYPGNPGFDVTNKAVEIVASGDATGGGVGNTFDFYVSYTVFTV